ncbi:hypothetical protein J3Q64DRAFT_1443390 [Phycomyces blakesleeanus]|uniref:Secreted protein n=1 Tax=Phycomyces blakesleeanus TaxID=4837 RepID=A0ABR3B436_PHYBL
MCVKLVRPCRPPLIICLYLWYVKTGAYVIQVHRLFGYSLRDLRPSKQPIHSSSSCALFRLIFQHVACCWYPSLLLAIYPANCP